MALYALGDLHLSFQSDKSMDRFGSIWKRHEQKIEKYVKMFKLCQCPRCMSDVEALALSRLPAQYVVLSSKNKVPLLSVYRSKYDSQVTTQIIYACKEVMQDPRH